MADVRANAVLAYTRVYREPPRVVAYAPGRVEVLGSHTETNGGYVLGAALDLGVAVAAGRIPGFAKAVEVWSEDLQASDRFPLDRILPERDSWANHPRGTVRELLRSGLQARGTRLAIASTLPMRSGLGSSSALAVATAEAFWSLYGTRPRDPIEAAKLCQRAESSFLGSPCALFDPLAARLGRKGHFVFLDALTLRHQQVAAWREDVRVVIVRTGGPRDPLDPRLAELRGSWSRAVSRLAELLPDPVRCLRDVAIERFESLGDQLEPEDRPRAEHVVRESARVLRGLAAIRARHEEELRSLLAQSHASSRDLLGISSPEVDVIVESAARSPGLLGGRMAGPGLGDAALLLVADGAADELCARVAEDFERRFGRAPERIVARIGDGASVEEVR